MKKAIFIMGEVGSGKTNYAKKLQTDYPDVVKIELGSLVRKKLKKEDRVFDDSLDTYLKEEVQKIVEKYHDKTRFFVIVGVRQPSLLKELEKIFDQNSHVFLVVPRSILKRRFEKRKSQKDKKISFDQAIAGDIKLGMNELILYLVRNTFCTFIQNY